MRQNELAAHLEGALGRDEGGDADAARALAAIISSDILTWQAPEADPAGFDTLLALTFGNRMAANGNRSPGPVNAALAAIASGLRRRPDTVVYAQWEVGEALAACDPAACVVHIHPARDARAEPVYLGTRAAIARAASLAGGAARMGRVGVVAFRDHLRRSVATARDLGLDAWAPGGISMPAAYDTLSGQPWCRDRLAYLLHDIAIGIAERRDALCAGMEWDQG